MLKGGGGGEEGGRRSKGLWPTRFRPFPRPSVTYALNLLLLQVLKIKGAWKKIMFKLNLKSCLLRKLKLGISCTFKRFLFYQYTETA